MNTEQTKLEYTVLDIAKWTKEDLLIPEEVALLTDNELEYLEALYLSGEDLALPVVYAEC